MLFTRVIEVDERVVLGQKGCCLSFDQHESTVGVTSETVCCRISSLSYVSKEGRTMHAIGDLNGAICWVLGEGNIRGYV